MSKLDKWKSQLQKPHSNPMFNLLGRVQGYSDDGKSMYVSVVGGNQLYDGPELLSVSLSADAGANAMRIEHMANPDDQAYKQPGDGGAVIELNSVRLTGGDEELNGQRVAQAQARFFKNFLSRTDVKNQAIIYPDTKFYTKLVPARQFRDADGQERMTRVSQSTSVFITSESQKIDSVEQFSSMVESHCQGRLPGRNIAGVLLQGSLDGEAFSVHLDPGLVKEQQTIDGQTRDFFRPRMGKEALDFFKQQPSWTNIEGMIKDDDITVVAIPSIISSSSQKELELSKNFDENGQLTQKGQAIHNQNHTIDGLPLLSKGVTMFRAVGSSNDRGAQPMRLHSTMPYAPGYDRYDHLLDSITTQFFTSNKQTPESAAMAINRKMREDKLAEQSKASNSPDAQNTQAREKPQPQPVPKDVQQATDNEIPPEHITGPEDDFNPDFGLDDEFNPDFGEQHAPAPIQAAPAPVDEITSDFDDDFDFSDELDEAAAPTRAM